MPNGRRTHVWFFILVIAVLALAGEWAVQWHRSETGTSGESGGHP